MWQLFYDLIYNQLFGSNNNYLDNFSFTLMENSTTMTEYLSSIIATICVIVVFVICCLCIYKVVKLIGRLFVRL